MQDLIGPYNKKVNHQQADGTVQQVVEIQLTLNKTFIDPATGRFKMAEVPNNHIKDIKKGKLAIERVNKVGNQVNKA